MPNRFSVSIRSNLIKSFLIYGLASACSKFISVLLLPIYTTIFSVEEYGEIDLIQSVILIITIFGILQLETSLQRYYYEFEGKERKKMISTILWSVTLLSALLVVVFCLFAGWISVLLFRTDHFRDLLILSSFLILFTNMTTIFFIIIRYMKKPGSFCRPDFNTDFYINREHSDIGPGIRQRYFRRFHGTNNRLWHCTSASVVFVKK